MSGFYDNPFGNRTIGSQFADPAVQQVASNSNAQLKNDEYNPFDIQPQPARSALYLPSSGPAIMQPTQETPKPPTYTRTGQQTVPEPKVALSTEELQRYQEELERREQELARREEEMRNTSNNIRRNNWPPLSEQCCFQPCFYQDIQVDIPLEFQKVVCNLYCLWIFHGIVLLANILGGLLMLDIAIIGPGILFFILFTPFSYLCWFRPAYKAFRSDSSFNFMVFFFVFFFQFMVTTIQAVGIPGSGTIGIITALGRFGQRETSILHGIIGLIIAIGFACAAAGDFFLILKIHRMYRNTGASMAKAQQEFTSEFLRNQHVRSAASSVAAAAVQSQFNQSPPDNRY